MKKKKSDKDIVSRIRLLRIMAIYAVFSLIVLILSVTLFKRMETSELFIEISETLTQTEYVYVKADTTPNTDTSSDEEEPIYKIREYMDKIGVFSENGSLVMVLDVYVKTLPEADKRLLGEGFEVIGRSALNAVVEDYYS